MKYLVTLFIATFVLIVPMLLLAVSLMQWLLHWTLLPKSLFLLLGAIELTAWGVAIALAFAWIFRKSN